MSNAAKTTSKMSSFEPQWVRIADHRQPEGHVNWQSYQQARMANGEVCTDCHATVNFPRYGRPAQCRQCREAKEDPGELLHNRRVRCPNCGCMEDPHEDCSDPALYAEGDDVPWSCWDCGASYEIGVRVSYTFMSPPKLGPEQRKDENQCR